MLPELLVCAAGALALYHYLGYPLLLQGLAARRPISTTSPAPLAAPALPSLTIIVPAYNEARVIEAKIQSLAELDYPEELVRVMIVLDGSRDATAILARAAIAKCARKERFALVEHRENRGKVAVVNEAISACNSELVVLTDTSAILPRNAALQMAAHFADPGVGVVCPTYALVKAGSEGERAYWRYQVEIKARESVIGSAMGAHGACYAFRTSLWRPLEADTINDDFILPMRIVAAGFRAIYDRMIVAHELEVTAGEQEFRRRVRIAAGNMQQLLRLGQLAHPTHGGTAFVFISGKVLRALMPFILATGAVALVYLSAREIGMYESIAAAAAVTTFALGVALAARRFALPKPLAWLGYFVEGNLAGLIGGSRYLLGRERQPWRRASERSGEVRAMHVPRSVEISKQVMDIICGLAALAVMALLFVPIALAIKLTSKGPVFYRQLRVGRQSPASTQLFRLFKFRTMYVDAETRSGAVWATKNDPRITPVGRFLRKTRLDELPQCLNVLMGDMSVIGPRPERPVFFRRLEEQIPFYSERIYGLKPGITGLAQVNQAYDETIEDVRNKLLYDHAYAARITTWSEWLRTDLGIVLSTARVMAQGKGQ